jgi:hypothetical protein
MIFRSWSAIDAVQRGSDWEPKDCVGGKKVGKGIVPNPVGISFSTSHTINNVVISVKRVIILIRHASNLVRLKGAQECGGELMGEICRHLMEMVRIYVDS